MPEAICIHMLDCAEVFRRLSSSLPHAMEGTRLNFLLTLYINTLQTELQFTTPMSTIRR